MMSLKPFIKLGISEWNEIIPILSKIIANCRTIEEFEELERRIELMYEIYNLVNRENTTFDIDKITSCVKNEK